MNVAVIIATHGESHWRFLARERAYPSASAEAHARPRNGVVMRHYPDYSLAQARNAAARETAADWLCFLDADDELESGYLDAMDKANGGNVYPTLIHGWETGPPPLFVPAVRRVYEHPPSPPMHAEPFASIPNQGKWPRTNEAVIGTLVYRSLFEALGGFRDFTDDGERILMYEDWDLWLRCWNSGAQLVYVPDAVYREHVAPTGRNTNAHLAQQVYDAIWRDHEQDLKVLGR